CCLSALSSLPSVSLHLLPRCCLLFTRPPTSWLYTLSLHDALPICHRVLLPGGRHAQPAVFTHQPRSGRDWQPARRGPHVHVLGGDRKSTRLNSSHVKISYAVFCWKKKIRCITCQHFTPQLLR